MITLDDLGISYNAHFLYIRNVGIFPELSLQKFYKFYYYWKLLLQTEFKHIDDNNLMKYLLGNKNTYIYNALEIVGINADLLTPNQIKALLFYHDKELCIIFKWHNFVPDLSPELYDILKPDRRLDKYDPNPDELEVLYTYALGKFPDLENVSLNTVKITLVQECWQAIKNNPKVTEHTDIEELKQVSKDNPLTIDDLKNLQTFGKIS